MTAFATLNDGIDFHLTQISIMEVDTEDPVVRASRDAESSMYLSRWEAAPECEQQLGRS